jgi:hypothetical protein
VTIETPGQFYSLDRLATVMEKGATRRAFLSDPWKTLAVAGIEQPADPEDPFSRLVDTLAEMSFEELTLIGRFGEGIHETIGHLDLLF